MCVTRREELGIRTEVPTTFPWISTVGQPHTTVARLRTDFVHESTQQTKESFEASQEGPTLIILACLKDSRLGVRPGKYIPTKHMFVISYRR